MILLSKEMHFSAPQIHSSSRVLPQGSTIEYGAPSSRDRIGAETDFKSTIRDTEFRAAP